MKALSVRQPWASLIAAGKKSLEVRSWDTDYRGPLVIVSSQTADEAACARWAPGHVLPRGVTVAVVDLVDVREGRPEDRERALGEATDAYVWELRNPRPLEPREITGGLGFYDVDDHAVIESAQASGGVAEAFPLTQPRPTPSAPTKPRVEWKSNIRVAVEPGDGGPKPYPHQIAAWDALDRHFGTDGGASRRAGMMVVPTGGGKTYLAARWLLRQHIAKGGRVLWLTHRRNLIVQAFKAFHDAASLATPKSVLRLIAISERDSRWSEVTDHDVVFSTIQTAAQRSKEDFLRDLSERAPGGLFVVIDEAHHAASPSYRRVLKLLKAQPGHRVLGLSATPVRSDEDDEKRMWQEFEAIIYQVDKRLLIEAGILAKPVTETVETRVDFEREFTDADYEHLSRYGDLGPRVLERLGKHAGRNHLIVDYYAKNRERFGKTIVFAANIEHSRTLTHEFKDKGIDADYVDYARGDSSVVIDRYRDESKPQVLANVEMLTEGFDAPRTRTVFIARPTQSESLLAQMVGRALRGTKAGGNETAYLVTFVDTWKQFHPFETDYVVKGGPVGEAVIDPTQSRPLVLIPNELILEAYKLLKSNVRGDFIGLHQCLPHSWRRWDREFESGEVQTRSVLVFDNQVDGFAQLESDYADHARIPAAISEALGRDLVRRYFGECQDPLPRWQDIKDLLDAYRDSIEVKRYTFDEKAKFDPERLARQFRDGNVGAMEIENQLSAVYQGDAVCRTVYSDFSAFFDEVNDHLRSFVPRAPKAPPKIIDLVPERLSAWPEGNTGHSLARILDYVLTQKKHFPKGPPKIGSVSYSRRDTKALWGYFRYSDQAMVVNKVLNAPDVPLFVLESLVYHEALHGDMPNAGHNKDFRDRERRYFPSEEARADAERRGLKATSGEGAWYVMAEQLLETFRDRFYVGHKVSM